MQSFKIIVYRSLYRFLQFAYHKSWWLTIHFLFIFWPSFIQCNKSEVCCTAVGNEILWFKINIASRFCKASITLTHTCHTQWGHKQTAAWRPPAASRGQISYQIPSRHLWIRGSPDLFWLRETRLSGRRESHSTFAVKDDGEALWRRKGVIKSKKKVVATPGIGLLF